MKEEFTPIERPPCKKHGLKDCKPCLEESIDRLSEIVREAAYLHHESELRPILDVGFTREQAEWLLENVITPLNTDPYEETNGEVVGAGNTGLHSPNQVEWIQTPT